VVINVRGTSGSGKSTLVRSVMERYKSRTPILQEGRRQPIGYALHNSPPMETVHSELPAKFFRSADPQMKPLWVVGHYETPCGGGDTIPDLDDVYNEVVQAANHGYDVLFEGLIVQSDVNRLIELSQSQKVLVIGLTTSLEECLAGVRARRAARGDERPLNPKNTESKYKTVPKTLARLRAAGVEVLELSREAALAEVCARLSL